MKTIQLFLLSLIVTIIVSCGNAVSQTESKPKTTTIPQLVVMVYDISRSIDAFATLNKSHFDMIYSGIGSNGGGFFYGLLVQSNSSVQDPLFLKVKSLELLTLKGNVYQQANRKKQNDQLIAKFDEGRSGFVTTASQKLILKKDQNFSDLKNALELAKTILENPMYANYTKKLIVISDMINDIPPVDGYDMISPVQFSYKINMALVRPSDRISLQDIIPEANYTKYTLIEDAINSMFNIP